MITIAGIWAQEESYQGYEMLPMQCKMARTALGLGVRDLAAEVGVSPDTIARLERGAALKESTVNSIEECLESRGIEFMSTDDGSFGVMVHGKAVSQSS